MKTLLPITAVAAVLVLTLSSLSAQRVWDVNEAAIDHIFRSAHSADVCLMLTGSGVVYRSEDKGDTWHLVHTGAVEDGSAHVLGLVWDGSRFILHSGKRLATSVDGLRWMDEISLSEREGLLLHLHTAQGKNRVIWLKESPDFETVILTREAESGTWKSGDPDPDIDRGTLQNSVRSLAFHGDTMIVISDHYVSSQHDYQSTLHVRRGNQPWEKVVFPVLGKLYGLTYFKGHFVAVGDFEGAYVSTDGTNWQKRGSMRLSERAWNIPHSVLHEVNGKLYVLNADFMASSADGENWDGWEVPADGNVVWTGSNFLTQNDRSFIRSVDGKSWSSSVPDNIIRDLGSRYLTHRGKHFMISASGGSFYTYRSSNLHDWELTISLAEAATGITAIAANDDRIVVVQGRWVYTSMDEGLTWSATEIESIPSQSSFRNVVWTGSRFEAVTSNDSRYSSTHGSTWTEHPPAITSVTALGAMDDLVVLGTRWGDIYTLRPGQEVQHRGNVVNAPIRHIVAADKAFIAAGDSGVIAFSKRHSATEEGVSWEKVESGTSAAITALVWTGSEAYALTEQGDILHSATGEVWTKRVFSGDLRPGDDFLHWTGSMLLSKDWRSGSLLSSTDGREWNVVHRTVQTYARLVEAAVAAEGRVVTVGDTGLIRFSDDLGVWHSRFLNAGVHLRDIAWAGGQFVATGSTRKPNENGSGSHEVPVVAISSDAGESWEVLELDDVDSYGRVVFHQGDTWWVVLDRFAFDGTRSKLFASTDLEQWEERYAADEIELKAMGWVDGRLLAGGMSKIMLYSDDGGQTWQEAETSLWNLSAMRNHQGVLYALDSGNDGGVISSSDGLNWEQAQWNRFVYGERFIFTPDGAVATGGELNEQIAYSADRQHWTSFRNVGLSYRIKGLVWHDNALSMINEQGGVLTMRRSQAPLPVITQQPQVIPYSDDWPTATFSVEAEAESVVGYQWQHYSSELKSWFSSGSDSNWQRYMPGSGRSDFTFVLNTYYRVAVFTPEGTVYSNTVRFLEESGVPYWNLWVNAVNGRVILGSDEGLYRSGSYVVLTAVPDEGYVFTGWSGGLSGDSEFEMLLMERDETVTAHFERADGETGLWRDAHRTDSEWRWLEWFGWFAPVEDWVFHDEHGWLYVVGDDTSSLFIFDMNLQEWNWTTHTVYPWQFWFGNVQAWTFFDMASSAGARWFFRTDVEEWRYEQGLVEP